MPILSRVSLSPHIQLFFVKWQNLDYTFQVNTGFEVPFNSPLATDLGVKFSQEVTVMNENSRLLLLFNYVYLRRTI